MTLREFLQEKEITAFELATNIILNVVVGEEVYALDVDTSQIPGGTVLKRTEQFTVEEDFIIVDNIQLSLETSLL